jgi:hypothetical protein
MTRLRHPEVVAIASVAYDWMLERGYMVDPDEGEIVADRVEPWDAIDLVDRLEAAGFDVTERSASVRAS